MKAGHHVRHLHAGIVDIVLHFHLLRAGTQHAHKGIAQRGIAQVPDVRRFVGIDIGVLDDDLPGGAAPARAGFGFAAQQRRAVGPPVQPDIDISVAGHLHGGHAGQRTDAIH